MILHKLIEDIFIIEGIPAIIIKSQKILVLGDIHVGLEQKYLNAGIILNGASQIMAAKILSLCNEFHVSKVLFLGDLKESISYPEKNEYDLLVNFINTLNMEILIAKGNHDGHLEELLQRIGRTDVIIKKEIILGKYSFIHGHSLPTKECLLSDIIFAAHGHFAVYDGDKINKVFVLSSNLKKRTNPKFLLLLPAFNQLIGGTSLNSITKKRVPFLNHKMFEWSGSCVFSIEGKKIG